MDSVILESVNLNDLAYEEIKKRIISREFAPGQRLVDSPAGNNFSNQPDTDSGCDAPPYKRGIVDQHILPWFLCVCADAQRY